MIPSLPGLRLLATARARTDDASTRPELWHRLMQGLGYERYGAHGGDFGSGVTTFMALHDRRR